MDVYRAINSFGLVDSLELETLSQELERRYELQLEALWHEDITIGEIFAKTKLRPLN